MTLTRIASPSAITVPLHKDVPVTAPSHNDVVALAPTRFTDFTKKAGKVTIAFDMSILVLVGIVSTILRWGYVQRFSLGINQSFLIFLIPTIWFIALAWQNAWVFSSLDSPSDLYVSVLRAGAVTFGGVAVVNFTFREHFSRGYVLLTISIGTSLLILQRMYARARFHRDCLEQNIKKNYLVLTCCDADPTLRQTRSDFPEALCHGYQIDATTTEWVDDFDSYLKRHGIDAVILCSELANDPGTIRRVVRLLDQIDCKLIFPDTLGEMALRREHLVQSSGAYSVVAEPFIQHSRAHFKRLLDILISTLALIVSAPVMAVIALSIRITSKGKVFYIDSRIGQGGVEFKFPKFRTMYFNADSMRLSVLGRPDENMTQRYRIDPRITPLGKYLRRFSLDELPQFWCVLVGTMSIVGPRPILKEELIQVRNADNYRHLARPGLTGLWQVSGRKETTWEERMALDVDYVQKWSPFVDAVLILRTFRVVLTGKGAY